MVETDIGNGGGNKEEYEDNYGDKETFKGKDKKYKHNYTPSRMHNNYNNDDD